ncbi:MAG: LysR family transcriptional regulator [Gammaproteobacteria bacterium]|nr:MAG: LysR family transcriptional regulator [Gammaproteobacteria bacterium]
MKITLEALTVFESINRNGSYAAAARELHKVPSAITYTINKLEEDLNLKLFAKSGRQMVLTTAGEEFSNHCKKLLAHAESLERSTSQIASGWENELRIAVNDIVPEDKILALFDLFYEEVDSTNIRLSKEMLSGSWDALLSDRVDLIIGAPHYIPPADYEVKSFCEIEFVFVVNKEHELAEQIQPITDEQINNYRVSVVADSNRSFATMSFDVFKDQKLLILPTHQMKNATQISGLCIGSVAKHLVKDALENNVLKIKEIENSSIVGKHQTYYAYRKNHMGKALDWFKNHLVNISHENQWLK